MRYFSRHFVFFRVILCFFASFFLLFSVCYKPLNKRKQEEIFGDLADFDVSRLFFVSRLRRSTGRLRRLIGRAARASPCRLTAATGWLMGLGRVRRYQRPNPRPRVFSRACA